MLKTDFKQTLDLVKGRLKLEDLLASYGIKINGKKLVKCPLHADSTPSLKVYGESWHCFAGCGSGDILNFVCKMENKTNIEALNSLCIRIGIDPITQESTNYLTNSLNNILKRKKVRIPIDANQMEIAFHAHKTYENIFTSNLTPYLLKKSVPHLFGTKSVGTKVVIPVCDVNGFIQCLQYIHANGFKEYTKGGKRDCGMFRLGPENTKFAFLAEGYATAASVHISTGETVFCCFTAGNIKNVYNLLKEKYANIRLVVSGDNDSPGKMHGLEAVYPPDKGADWNDHYLKYGAESVNKLLGGSVEKIL
jgi:phage/plasmid primase-like uncharacterized protein